MHARRGKVPPAVVRNAVNPLPPPLECCVERRRATSSSTSSSLFATWKADERAVCRTLRKAAELGCVMCLQYYHTQRIDLDAPQTPTLLMTAASKGQLSTLEFLCELGANASAASPASGWTALHAAAAKGHAHCVDALCKRGATAVRRFGDSPADLAVAGGHTAALRVLARHGAKIDVGDAARLAITHKQQEVLRFLHDELRMDVNSCESRNKCSLVHTAASKGAVECLRLLLREYAGDVHGHPQAEQTPLHAAILNGHADAARELLHAGANPNAESRVNGAAPLHHAGDMECWNLLLDHGARTDVRNDQGLSPFHLAATRHHRNDFASRVLKHVVSSTRGGGRKALRSRALDGSTVLHYVAWIKWPATIRALHLCGADDEDDYA